MQQALIGCRELYINTIAPLYTCITLLYTHIHHYAFLPIQPPYYLHIHTLSCISSLNIRNRSQISA